MSHVPLMLDPDRVFDADPSIRRVARTLFEETATLPIVAPHGHVDPALLASDAPFPEPASLLVVPDHYLIRLLYSQGIAMESLGVPTRDGTPWEQDPRAIWRRFATHAYRFRGTPSGLWLDFELHELFGVRERLTRESADRVYDQIAERLAAPEYRPRALFDRFGIELLATTDAASDSLEHHAAIRASGWGGRVIPTFRPDALFRIAAPAWRDACDALERVTGRPVDSYAAFVDALRMRRAAFAEAGATATDHAVVEPRAAWVSESRAEALFASARAGTAIPADQEVFEAHMLMTMAQLSCEDGLVMQLHPGAWRDHNPLVAARFGPDRGADIPVATEFTRNLAPLLGAFGNDARFRLVLFTLDESTYARELAPLAGHYPALRLGPAWWFHDSVEGMLRYRERTSETATIWNTAGFNDDTRAFCSIPARHDLSRRVDATWLARQVVRHLIDLDDARHMARALAVDLVRETYRLPAPSAAPVGAH
ncbi:MAG: glucuronate isomerase [Gemmatimonadaceae bacterium]|jgi:glucuronate isomerase|nr:glucuronate isomerase [Gemmatimonadaceae bacterium]